MSLIYSFPTLCLLIGAFNPFSFKVIIDRCISISSVTQLCPTLCDPMDCSMPGFPVLHCLLEFAQTHVHCVNDAIQPSHPLSTPSPPVLSLSPESGSFPMNHLFTSGGQRIRTSASVLSVSIQLICFRID